VEEKVIEKIVEVDTGIRDEHIKDLEARANEDAEKLKAKAQKEVAAITDEKVTS